MQMPFPRPGPVPGTLSFHSELCLGWMVQGLTETSSCRGFPGWVYNCGCTGKMCSLTFLLSPVSGRVCQGGSNHWLMVH